MSTEISRYTSDQKEAITLRLHALQLAFEQQYENKPVFLFLSAINEKGFDVLVSDSQLPAKYALSAMTEIFPQYLQRSGMPPDLQLTLGLSIIANLETYLANFNTESI